MAASIVGVQTFCRSRNIFSVIVFSQFSGEDYGEVRYMKMFC